MKSFEFKNGDKLPMLGLGTWKSEPGEVYAAVREAITIGYRHIDCAAIYLNEKEIGKALTDAFAAGDVGRKEMHITSKLWNNSHREEQVSQALKNTLLELQLDYLDLYLVHWPVVLKDGVMFPKSVDDYVTLEEVPLSQTWKGMEQCVSDGLTRHIGVSNFSVKKLQELSADCSIKPEVNQVELQPLLQQNDLLEYCDSYYICLTAYSPLGSKDRIPQFKDESEPDLFKIPAILDIAESHRCTAAEILISWAIQRGTSVIPKSVNPQRLKQNFTSQSIELTDGEMEKIKALDQQYRFINGRFWTVEGSPYTYANLWDE